MTTWLDADQSRALLAAYGIPLVPETVAATPEEAVRAADELGGGPMVVKSAVPGAHKTETGGVILDVRGDDAVYAAAAQIGGGVLVQPMLEGAELIAGVVHDPLFGPLVALGLGGVLAELVGAVSIAIAPLTDADADQLVHAGPVGRLVAGFRGKPPLDAEAIADLVHRLSALALDVPEIAELDLNPGARDGGRLRRRRQTRARVQDDAERPRQDLVAVGRLLRSGPAATLAARGKKSAAPRRTRPGLGQRSRRHQ